MGGENELSRLRTWLRWLGATILGYVIGVAVAVSGSHAVGWLISVVSPVRSGETDILVGLSVGVCVGAAQVLFFRDRIGRRAFWVWGTTIGIGVPYTVAVMLEEAHLGVAPAVAMWAIPLTVLGAVGAAMLQKRERGPQGAGFRQGTGAGVSIWVIMPVVLFIVDDLALGLVVGIALLGVVSGGIVARQDRSGE